MQFIQVINLTSTTIHLSYSFSKITDDDLTTSDPDNDPDYDDKSNGESSEENDGNRTVCPEKVCPGTVCPETVCPGAVCPQ